MSNKRQLKNLIISPRFQFKLCLYYFVSGLIFLSAIVMIAYQKMLNVQTLMKEKPVMDFQIQSQVNDLMFEIVQFTLIGFVAYIAFTSVFAIIISHRIAGPVVAITAFIEELKRGNYDYKRNLRPNDELKEIMDGLKELAPILKERGTDE
jgi:signal transduction histidine kinase